MRSMRSSVFLSLVAGFVALVGCEGKVETMQGLKCRTFLGGRVSVEFRERKRGLGINVKPEYMIYRFNDVGKYNVSFQIPHECKSGYWKCPEDFGISIDSGTREVVKEFDSLLGLAPSFGMTVSRDGESQSCEYSSLGGG